MNTPPDLTKVLQENLPAFHGFARKRTGDEQSAADAVQESLLRALKAESRLKHGREPAGVAMSLSSVSVIANALRLRRITLAG